MIIRKAKDSDLKDCLIIQGRDREWNIKKLKDSLKNNKVIFLVAKEEELVGFIVGYLDPCMQKDAIIHEVRVDELKRNQGIGTALVDAFVKACFSKGATNVSALIQRQHLDFYKNSCKFKEKLKWIEVNKS